MVTFTIAAILLTITATIFIHRGIRRAAARAAARRRHAKLISLISLIRRIGTSATEMSEALSKLGVSMSEAGAAAERLAAALRTAYTNHAPEGG